MKYSKEELRRAKLTHINDGNYTFTIGEDRGDDVELSYYFKDAFSSKAYYPWETILTWINDGIWCNVEILEPVNKENYEIF